METLYRTFIIASFVVGGIIKSSLASAAVITVFNDRTAFENSATVVTETFNSIVSDQSFNGAIVDLGDFSLSSQFVDARNLVDALPAEAGGTSIDGTTFLNYFLNGTDASIVFDAAITAIGFDIQAFGNVGNVSSLSVLDQVFDQNDIGSGLLFFGLTSDTPFTSITFSSTINDGFSLDNLSYGIATTAVPTPTLLGVLLSALVLIFVRSSKLL